MSHYAQTTAWLANAKAVVKHHQDAADAYFVKFVRNKAVPTQHDVDEYTKVLAAMEAAAKALNEDRLEMDHVANGFGGQSDTVVHTYKTLLETLKKGVHH